MKQQMLKDYFSVKKGTYVTLKLAGTNYQVSQDGGKSYFALLNENERKEYVGYLKDNIESTNIK